MSLLSFLTGVSQTLSVKGSSLTIGEVREMANTAGFRNNKGLPYSSNRGFGRSLSLTFDKLEISNPASAKKLADTIVGTDGKPAWLKKYK